MSHDSVARRGRRPGDLRVVVRRAAKLPRTLGAPSLFAACYGNVGSSIYYALGVTAAFALGLTPIALILAGFIFVTTALNYAEGTAALPHAGGSSSFARRAFNVPIGLLIIVNVIGIQESSAINLVLAFTDLITQVVLVILGIILLLHIDRI